MFQDIGNFPAVDIKQGGFLGTVVKQYSRSEECKAYYVIYIPYAPHKLIKYRNSILFFKIGQTTRYLTLSDRPLW